MWKKKSVPYAQNFVGFFKRLLFPEHSSSLKSAEKLKSGCITRLQNYLSINILFTPKQNSLSFYFGLG